MNFDMVVQRTLGEHLKDLLEGRHAIRTPTDLARARELVEAQFGRGQAGLVTDDRVDQAVRELLKKGAEPTSRHLFLLSHALTRRLDALQGKPVLESSLGAKLLDAWETIAGRSTLRLSQWRGLFHSFLQAERGVRFERLRTLLRHSPPAGGVRPAGNASWIGFLARHQQLLGDRPVEPYVREIVAGHRQLLDDLTSNVQISDASWLWSEITQAIEVFVSESGEQEFKAALPGLLEFQGSMSASGDSVLMALLNRYGACTDRPRHPVLIERTLKAWGSPQLKSNHRWTKATKAAHHMVCNWLAQEDLEDFYHLCRGDSAVDARRLEFWLRFTQQMGYTQILLGGALHRSRDVDIREFIDKRGNRLGRLQGGPSTNNAILMQIGAWMFVEFSEIGHACQFWRMAGSLFETGRDVYSINEFRRDIASPRRLLHMDGRETWEDKFLYALEQIGIRPDASSEELGHGSEDRGAAALLSRLLEYDVDVVDNRAKGGALWAFPRSASFDGYDELRKLGMKFKADKKGFYWP